MTHDAESSIVKLSLRDWGIATIFLVIHAAALVSFYYRDKSEVDRRLTIVETNQKTLIKILDRMESRRY